MDASLLPAMFHLLKNNGSEVEDGHSSMAGPTYYNSTKLEKYIR